MSTLKTEEVDGLTVDFFSELVSTYLKKVDFPIELINNQKQSETIESLIHHQSFDAEWRNNLADIIQDQYKKLTKPLEQDSKTYDNIEKLRAPNTVTVTTGQQIHIFLGPLFVVYKVLSCLAHAKKIEQENPEINAVPIFWMATEDHDFDEISSVRIYNQLYTWAQESNGPVGRLNPKSILPLLSEVRARMDSTEENKRFLDLCELAYSSHPTFALATHFIMHQLFGDLGIVVLDPDDKRLKQKVVGDIKQDILQQKLSPKIDSSIELMKKNGIKAPINTRPINYFYLTDTSRNRIEQSEEGRFQIVDTSISFSRAEMEEEIDKYTDRFSPNALLRPVYQQAILPNVSYICGGSEIVYWFELKSLMLNLNLIYPHLEIRKSVFILGNAIQKKMAALNAPISSLFLSDDSFVHQIVSLQNNEISLLKNQIDEFTDKFNTIITSLELIQNQPLPKRLIKSKNQFENDLKASLDAAVEQISNRNNEISKLKNLKDKVFGNQYIQERHDYIINNLSTVMELISTNYRVDIDYENNSFIGIVVRI